MDILSNRPPWANTIEPAHQLITSKPGACGSTTFRNRCARQRTGLACQLPSSMPCAADSHRAFPQVCPHPHIDICTHGTACVPEAGAWAKASYKATRRLELVAAIALALDAASAVQDDVKAVGLIALLVNILVCAEVFDDERSTQSLFRRTRLAQQPTCMHACTRAHNMRT